jgi:DNA-binding GntR family transcriptional regulator
LLKSKKEAWVMMMEEFEPQLPEFKRESTRDQIREHILKCILDGTFPPGYRLREIELARSLGTSQAPVREALRELEGLHYVVTFPFKGTQVRKVSASDLADAYLLRGLLDQAAAVVACEREKADWSELRSIADKAMEAAKLGDRKAYADIDIAFHKYIIKASQVWLIEKLWNLLSFAVQVRGAANLLDVPLIDLAKQHYLIVDALEQGDGETAGRVLREQAGIIRGLLKELAST